MVTGILGGGGVGPRYYPLVFPSLSYTTTWMAGCLTWFLNWQSDLFSNKNMASGTPMLHDECHACMFFLVVIFAGFLPTVNKSHKFSAMFLMYSITIIRFEVGITKWFMAQHWSTERNAYFRSVSKYCTFDSYFGVQYFRASPNCSPGILCIYIFTEMGSGENPSTTIYHGNPQASFVIVGVVVNHILKGPKTLHFPGFRGPKLS